MTPSPFTHVLSLLDNAFASSPDPSDEAARLQQHLKDVLYIGESEDIDRALKMLADIEPPKDDLGHRLELIAVCLYGAYLANLKEQRIDAGTHRRPEADPDGRPMMMTAGVECLTCRAMTCGFLREADRLRRGLRTRAIGQELPDEIARLKIEFESLIDEEG